MDKLGIIDGYLRELGVNENVIKYMRENRIYLIKYFENILGKDFYIYNNEIYKKDFLKKLKSGSDEFKIFDNGSIWFSSTSDPKIETGLSFARNAGFISFSENKKYDEIKISRYISFENGNVIKRQIEQKKKIKDNQIYYDGTILEEINVANSKSHTSESAYFFDSITPLPSKSLSTTKQFIGEFGYPEKTEFNELNYDNHLWYLISNGKVKNQDLIENLNPQMISTKEKYRLIKQNIFSRIKSKSKIFDQLREQCMDLLTNENLDGVIHCEFSMKGKEGEICTWTLERVTELSREIIFQINFQNTEQFKQQVLHPLLIGYAQTNSVISGRVNQSDTGLSRYRAFSTTNNVVTINNISQEYANYISTEIQKVEPVIYNKQMEQKQIQQENQNGYGYQKINKKNNGFLNILFLASIVGYISGLILFIIGIFLRKNI